ncbi:MAG TPA: GtrA family protein [Candidatus Angelobacter sp.]|jgi:putative flippase GtrA|nr:GtrA family protein [Candidatus Angelobacter sp.]
MNASSVGGLIKGHYRRFASFLCVGLTGVVTTNGGLWLLHSHAGVGSVYLAGILAGEAGILVTFVLNNLFTWRGQGHRPLWLRLALFHVVTCGGLGLYLLTIAVLHGGLGVYYVAAGLCGSGAAAVWNYLASHYLIFHGRHITEVLDDEDDAMPETVLRGTVDGTSPRLVPAERER